MAIPAVILIPDKPATKVVVGGLHPVNRHIIELYGLGIRKFYLVGAVRTLSMDRFCRVPEDASIHKVDCPNEKTAENVQSLGVPSEDILLVRGDCLVDPRLAAELLRRKDCPWLRIPAEDGETLPAMARLSRRLLTRWANSGLTGWLKNSPELIPDSVDNYSPSHRGRVPFYLLQITTPETAEAATRTLIRNAQKKVLDIPALVLDPIFENRLVNMLCPTRITPNQITLFTAGLGIFIAFLFFHGYFRLGSLLAYAVEVLDGVDGKLARTRLQFSRLGEMEHVFDFFMEQAWYLCITLSLYTGTGNQKLLWVGIGLMACDLIDSLCYYLIHVRLGKELDELGGFDRAFRLVGGRRNIYMWMFLFGSWAGYPAHTFVAVFVWAAITVGVHGSRVIYHLNRTAAAPRT